MNRRELLKTMGIVTAASALGGLPQMAKAIQRKAQDEPKKKAQDMEAVLDKPVTAIVIGAGNRGKVYAEYAALFPKSLQIAGVSDNNEERTKAMGDKYQVPEQYRFGDWSEVFRIPKFADAVIIATPDNLHTQPCLKALEMGYDVLLEKPVAPTVQECLKIAAHAHKYNRIVGVCHVLRYAPYFVALKNTLDAGTIGDIVSVQHLEPIEFGHMAHSYVRGNWHNSKETTPIILAKSCHDLDIIRWLVGKKCKRVSAFGNLKYFKKENAPAGSSTRCLECGVESQCAYSAQKIYLRDRKHVYAFHLPEDQAQSEAALRKVIETTHYGQCVFRCNNDQCDHYVMNMEFESGITAAFSMEAFTSIEGRRTRIMGTQGFIEGDMATFSVTDFKTGKKDVWHEDISGLHGYDGHGGGDLRLVKDFVLAVGKQDAGLLTSSIDVSIESHVMGFKAEDSRLRRKIVTL